MTKKAISEMNLEEVQARIAELDTEVRSMTDADAITTAANEKKELVERKRELEDLEKRQKDAAALNAGEAKAKKIIDQRGNDMNEKKIETRNTLEYGQAFVKGFKSGDFSECRALLSSNASGAIPVPEVLDSEIRNAWEEAQLISLVKKTYYKGNVKVGFEISATGAVVHVEGAEAPEEEVLELGTVELKAESIKKWITVSDEAIDNTTIDTLGYIYAEVAQKIVEKAEDVLIAKIVASPETSSSTAPAVPKYTATTPALDTVVNAVALLSGKARNLHITMNRQTKAVFKSLALNANYGVDPFDGLEDRIVYSDAIKSFAAAQSGETYMIIGDFAYGAQANFPSGNEITLKIDDLSLAEKDLVKIVGRQFVGLGVVAPYAFVRIVK